MTAPRKLRRSAAGMSETDLAAKVVVWLHEQGWEVFQEVQMRTSGPCCDIVAKRGPVVWAIECKLQFGVAVVEQARYWVNRANFVSIAVPHVPFDHVLAHYCRLVGIGAMRVDEYGINFTIANRLARQTRCELGGSLREEHKVWAKAGNNKSERYSPFKATCRSLLDVVKQNPGVTMKAAVDAIHHHYSTDATARGSLTKWIQEGSVPGVELRRDGRRVTLWEKAA